MTFPRPYATCFANHTLISVDGACSDRIVISPQPVGANSDVSLAAMQAVARLSVLTRLRMASFPMRSSAQMPRCEELACLRSSSLQNPNMSIHQVINAVR